MTDQLTDVEYQAACRVRNQLAPEVCRACDGDGEARDANSLKLGWPCLQCHGVGRVSMLDRLGTTVGLARHPNEPDDAFRLRIIDLCKGQP